MRSSFRGTGFPGAEAGETEQGRAQMSGMDERRRALKQARGQLSQREKDAEEARRHARAAQEALGDCEDELSAAETGRDSGENAAAANASDVERRIGRAEDAWTRRVEEAEAASTRSDAAAEALEEARDIVDERLRDLE
jgi:hypothetical protein